MNEWPRNAICCISFNLASRFNTDIYKNYSASGVDPRGALGVRSEAPEDESLSDTRRRMIRVFYFLKNAYVFYSLTCEVVEKRQI